MLALLKELQTKPMILNIRTPDVFQVAYTDSRYIITIPYGCPFSFEDVNEVLNYIGERGIVQMISTMNTETFDESVVYKKNDLYV